MKFGLVTKKLQGKIHGGGERWGMGGAPSPPR